MVAPGLPHHVTQRGNRRQQGFFSPICAVLRAVFLATPEAQSAKEMRITPQRGVTRAWGIGSPILRVPWDGGLPSLAWVPASCRERRICGFTSSCLNGIRFSYNKQHVIIAIAF